MGQRPLICQEYYVGGVDPPLVEDEHPVESLSRVVSEEDEYVDGGSDNSSNEQSFILD